VNQRDLDDAFRRAADAAPPVDPALISRISESIGASIEPVRPLPRARIQATAMAGIGAVVAVAAGAMLGMHGAHRMSAGTAVWVFVILALLLWMAARASASQMIPGSGGRTGSWLLLAAICACMGAVFAMEFHDPYAGGFVKNGIPCLVTGLITAVPVAAACWLVLRRGLAVNATAAGLAVGALAGLAGLAALELHCANFESAHLLVWHTGVPLVSGLSGALLAVASRRRRNNRR
jgi:hypothetical protein